MTTPNDILSVMTIRWALWTLACGVLAGCFPPTAEPPSALTAEDEDLASCESIPSDPPE